MFADIVSAGWVWGLVAAGVCALVCIGFIFFGMYLAFQGGYDRGTGVGMAVIATICLLVVGGAWLWGSWPLKYDYHHWVDKQGTVQAVGHRLISNGDSGINDRYVFRIAGQPYGVDDTRASLTKVGDKVHLRCKKEHQFFQHFSDDGWACRWINGEGV